MGGGADCGALLPLSLQPLKPMAAMAIAASGKLLFVIGIQHPETGETGIGMEPDQASGKLQTSPYIEEVRARF
jgi:hypothetical protein